MVTDGVAKEETTEKPLACRGRSPSLEEEKEPVGYREFAEEMEEKPLACRGRSLSDESVRGK
jgi:hypothetical protein